MPTSEEADRAVAAIAGNGRRLRALQEDHRRVIELVK